MSKQIWFIRHGESVTNAGGSWPDAHSIPLTPTGQEQAVAASKALAHEPCLIVTSPYIRTLETARPTLSRWPDAPHEEWQIQEFSYLCDKRLGHPTAEEFYREDRIYWEKQDPHHQHGPNAESFVQLIDRVDDTIDRINKLDNERTLFFSHALFMKMIIYRLENPQEDLSKRNDFRSLFMLRPIGNTAIAHFTIEECGAATMHSLSVDHLDDDETV